MKYEISHCGKKLTFIADEDDIQELKELNAEYPTQWNQSDFDPISALVANSELDYTWGGETGDLTDAPMFGIRDENGDIEQRWAFMDYQVENYLQVLMDKGEVTFISD